MKRVAWFIGAVVVVILAVAEWAAGGEQMSHSGRIVAIDPDTATFVLEEVGPWRTKDGVTQVTRLTIAITDSTKLTRARRVETEAADRWPGEFIEEPAEPWTIIETDFVTVRCRHDGRELIALEIIAVTIPQP
jgi:hypothetical protein